MLTEFRIFQLKLKTVNGKIITKTWLNNAYASERGYRVSQLLRRRGGGC
jgi:hypothetical protein